MARGKKWVRRGERSNRQPVDSPPPSPLPSPPGSIDTTVDFPADPYFDPEDVEGLVLPDSLVKIEEDPEAFKIVTASRSRFPIMAAFLPLGPMTGAHGLGRSTH